GSVAVELTTLVRFLASLLRGAVSNLQLFAQATFRSRKHNSAPIWRDTANGRKSSVSEAPCSVLFQQVLAIQPRAGCICGCARHGSSRCCRRAGRAQTP